MKEGRRKCLKCGASPSNNPSTVLHRFPKPGKTNSLRCELWAKFCLPHESWQSLEFQTKLYSEHRMLCTRHFKKTWFIDPAGTKLFKSATPDHECDMILRNLDEIPDLQPQMQKKKEEEVQDVQRLSPIDEPRAGPSQALLDNINLVNFDQNTRLAHQPVVEDSETEVKFKHVHTFVVL